MRWGAAQLPKIGTDDGTACIFECQGLTLVLLILNGQQFLPVLFVNFDEKEEHFGCLVSVRVMLSFSPAVSRFPNGE